MEFVRVKELKMQNSLLTLQVFSFSEEIKGKCWALSSFRSLCLAPHNHGADVHPYNMIFQEDIPSFPQIFPLLPCSAFKSRLFGLRLFAIRKQRALERSIHSTKSIICVLVGMSLSDPPQRAWFDGGDRWGRRGLDAFMLPPQTLWAPCAKHWEYMSLPSRSLLPSTLKRHKCIQNTRQIYDAFMRILGYV